MTTDARSAARHTTSTGVMHPGSTLTDAVRSLVAQSVAPALMFATPTAADGKRGPDYARAGRAGSGADDLVTMAARISTTGLFAKYTPVVRRWEELTGQPVPVPTEPSRNGKPRLNPAFSQWLMGWPAGWVTDIPGLSRTAQLMCIGNGVVPQQAAYALRLLLDDVEAAL